MKNQEIQQIYGYHSVKAALNNPRRRNFTLFIIEKYKDLLKKITKIPKTKILSTKEMTKLFGNETVTQGIVLNTAPLQNKNINEIFLKIKKNDPSLIVVLDQVTDPQNIGSIMRSCALFNCNTLVVGKDHAPNITPALTKSASGAAELVNYIKVVNLKRTLEDLKKKGYWVYGLDGSSKNHLEQINLPKKCVLVLGSENKGIRDLNKKTCDALFSLRYQPNKLYEIDSLNVSNACSIALYEHFKKYN
tara:strand:- start:596 stop:1336 length:741 start_codon:yes stop_codon:yes gene_type:complete